MTGWISENRWATMRPQCSWVAMKELLVHVLCKAMRMSSEPSCSVKDVPSVRMIRFSDSGTVSAIRELSDGIQLDRSSFRALPALDNEVL